MGKPDHRSSGSGIVVLGVPDSVRPEYLGRLGGRYDQETVSEARKVKCICCYGDGVERSVSSNRIFDSLIDASRMKFPNVFSMRTGHDILLHTSSVENLAIESRSYRSNCPGNLKFGNSGRHGRLVRFCAACDWPVGGDQVSALHIACQNTISELA